MRVQGTSRGGGCAIESSGAPRQSACPHFIDRSFALSISFFPTSSSTSRASSSLPHRSPLTNPVPCLRSSCSHHRPPSCRPLTISTSNIHSTVAGTSLLVLALVYPGVAPSCSTARHLNCFARSSSLSHSFVPRLPHCLVVTPILQSWSWLSSHYTNLSFTAFHFHRNLDHPAFPSRGDRSVPV
jgi:hypothetical protein